MFADFLIFNFAKRECNLFVTPNKFPIIEGALEIGIQLPLFFLEISMEQTKICFHQINQIFQKTYVKHCPSVKLKKIIALMMAQTLTFNQLLF